MEDLGNIHKFDMARKETHANYFIRILHHMFYYDKPFRIQGQLGVMIFPEAHEY